MFFCYDLNYGIRFPRPRALPRPRLLPTPCPLPARPVPSPCGMTIEPLFPRLSILSSMPSILFDNSSTSARNDLNDAGGLARGVNNPWRKVWVKPIKGTLSPMIWLILYPAPGSCRQPKGDALPSATALANCPQPSNPQRPQFRWGKVS